MKYLLLPALALSAVTILLTGCGSDINHSHDIYREHYVYKPLPQDTAAPAAKPTNAPDAGGSAVPPP